MKVTINHSQKHDNNLCFTDYFQNQNRNLVLFTHFRKPHPSHEAVNSLILQKVIGFDLENRNWNSMVTDLQSFIVDLNWELFALFKRLDVDETGVSLLLIVIENDNLCFVSCGRFLCGLMVKESLTEIGKGWNDPHLTTIEELGLLGAIGNDITVKPECLVLPSNSIFIGYHYDALRASTVKQTSPYNLNALFIDEYIRKPFPYCLIGVRKEYLERDMLWFKAKKFRFSVAAMLIVLLFSLYYLYLGKNTVEDRLHVTREQFQLTVRNIDFLKLQEILPLDYGILFVPQRNIELIVDWESELPYAVTLAPYFDLRQLFLVSGNFVHSYDKRDKKNLWSLDFKQRVNNLEILDSNLMLVSTSANEYFCLKRDSGDIVWSRQSIEGKMRPETSVYKPIQVSLEKDRRLNTSIILIPDPENLVVLNILNGDTLYHYSSDSRISYISDFDFVEKSIYMVKGDKLYKVRFDVRN